MQVLVSTQRKKRKETHLTLACMEPDRAFYVLVIVGCVPLFFTQVETVPRPLSLFHLILKRPLGPLNHLFFLSHLTVCSGAICAKGVWVVGIIQQPAD